MKHMITLTILGALVSGHTTALAGRDVNCYTVKSKKCTEKSAETLPTSIDEFLELRDRIGDDPYGGAQLLIYALMVRLDDPDLADQMIVLSLAADQLNKGGKDTYKGYTWKSNWSYHIKNTKKYPHCVRGFATTSSPENDYVLDKKAVAIRFREQTKYVGSVDSGKYKVFACTSGADTCKPISLTRNKKGIWKVKEFSSVVGGCRKPASELEPEDYSDDL